MNEEIQDLENEEEELAPAVDMGVTLISCADCGRPLLNMLKVRDTGDSHKVKVRCINKRCNDGERGESWTHTLTGQYFHSTIKSRDVVSAMYEEDGTMIIEMDKE